MSRPLGGCFMFYGHASVLDVGCGHWLALLLMAIGDLQHILA